MNGSVQNFEPVSLHFAVLQNLHGPLSAWHPETKRCKTACKKHITGLSWRTQYIDSWRRAWTIEARLYSTNTSVTIISSPLVAPWTQWNGNLEGFANKVHKNRFVDVKMDRYYSFNGGASAEPATTPQIALDLIDNYVVVFGFLKSFLSDSRPPVIRQRLKFGMLFLCTKLLTGTA